GDRPPVPALEVAVAGVLGQDLADQLGDVEALLPADVRQGHVAATAEVEAVAGEHAGGAGARRGEVAERVLGTDVGEGGLGHQEGLSKGSGHPWARGVPRAHVTGNPRTRRVSRIMSSLR